MWFLSSSCFLLFFLLQSVCKDGIHLKNVLDVLQPKVGKVELEELEKRKI